MSFFRIYTNYDKTRIFSIRNIIQVYQPNTNNGNIYISNGNKSQFYYSLLFSKSFTILYYSCQIIGSQFFP